MALHCRGRMETWGRCEIEGPNYYKSCRNESTRLRFASIGTWHGVQHGRSNSSRDVPFSMFRTEGMFRNMPILAEPGQESFGQGRKHGYSGHRQSRELALQQTIYD